jgi:hypothetical protein
MTSKELAAETGIAERYAREWLSHQASGYLDHDPAPGAFTVTPEQAMVFADSNSPVYSRSLRNDGYGADSSPSRGDISRHAFRPTATSAAAIRNVRLTSTRDIAPCLKCANGGHCATWRSSQIDPQRASPLERKKRFH